MAGCSWQAGSGLEQRRHRLWGGCPPHEPRRLIREDGRLFHQLWTGAEWTDVCEFTLDPMHPNVASVLNNLGETYWKLGRHDAWPKAGVALILSGAFGNLIDRLQLHKVTDFIDMGIPGYAWRWPTFNIADRSG